jgi:hypothetical protein
MEPTYFATPEDFRNWFLANHLHAKELIVGYYKKGTKVQSIDWPQSVDQALCFGWIDGVRRSVDANRYCIRFTPRRKKQHLEFGKSQTHRRIGRNGIADRRREEGLGGTKIRRSAKFIPLSSKVDGLSTEYEAQFQANAVAWANFSRMIPSYKKPCDVVGDECQAGSNTAQAPRHPDRMFGNQPQDSVVAKKSERLILPSHVRPSPQISR